MSRNTQTKTQVLKWANGATSTTTAQATESVRPWGDSVTVQVTVTGTGAVAATAPVEVSNDNANWIVAQSLSLSGTGSDTDGVAIAARWGYVRVGTLSAISGTGATITAVVGGAGA